LWRNRDYVILRGSQSVSEIGSQVSTLAFLLLILALTHSPAEAGLAGALAVLPFAVLGLPAGALVDRWNRKRLMILCDAGRTLALASIPLAGVFGHLTVLQVYLVILVAGTLSVFFDLAAGAVLPRLVSNDQLPAAVTVNNISYSLSVLLGPALGGFLFQSVARVAPFVLDAASYAVSVIGLAFIRAEFQAERQPAPSDLGTEISQGLSWLWGQPTIRFLAFFNAIGGLMFSALELLLVILATHRFHAPGTAVGLLLSLQAVGILIGSLIASRLQRWFGFGHLLIAIVWTEALLFPLYAVAPSLPLMAIVTVPLLLAGGVQHVVITSYRLAVVPDALRGRVNSVFHLITLAAQPAALALAGVLLQWGSPAITILIFAGPMFGIAIAATLDRHTANLRFGRE
jgi:MFS family permease